MRIIIEGNSVEAVRGQVEQLFQALSGQNSQIAVTIDPSLTKRGRPAKEKTAEPAATVAPDEKLDPPVVKTEEKKKAEPVAAASTAGVTETALRDMLKKTAAQRPGDANTAVGFDRIRAIIKKIAGVERFAEIPQAKWGEVYAACEADLKTAAAAPADGGLGL